MAANPKAAKAKARKAHTQARQADAAYKSARVQARRERKGSARKRAAAAKRAKLMAERGPRVGARRFVGLAAYVGVGVFPYLASYVILPAGAVVVLMALWAFGLLWTIRIARTAPEWTPAGAITAIGVWIVAVQGGDTLFGWL
jgi:Flp pilus assembly protein TadB